MRIVSPQSTDTRYLVMVDYQASTLTQIVTGPVGPVILVLQNLLLIFYFIFIYL